MSTVISRAKSDVWLAKYYRPVVKYFHFSFGGKYFSGHISETIWPINAKTFSTLGYD